MIKLKICNFSVVHLGLKYFPDEFDVNQAGDEDAINEGVISVYAPLKSAYRFCTFLFL